MYQLQRRGQMLPSARLWAVLLLGCLLALAVATTADTPPVQKQGSKTLQASTDKAEENQKLVAPENKIEWTSQPRTFEENIQGMAKAEERRREQEMIDETKSTRGIASCRKELEENAKSKMNDTAMAALAELYLFGDTDIPIDKPAGMALLQEAAQLGNPRAHALLGIFKTPKDEAEAQIHLWLAAHSGDHIATSVLAYRTLYGRSGSPKDCTSAANLYRVLSAQQVEIDEDSSVIIAQAKTEPIRLAQLEWPHDDTDGELLGTYQFLADSGNTRALVALGQLHAIGGHGVQPDYKMAADYFRQAAAAGEPLGEASLGYLYEHGLGVPQSNETAVQFYSKAGNQGSPAALTRLGELRLTGGLGLTKDPAQAKQYFESAAVSGLPRAVAHLGDVYREEGNTVKAISLYSAAHKAGSIVATHRMADLIIEEKGLTNKGTMCEAALLFKHVAENNAGLDNILQEAEILEGDGEDEKALARYELASEMGSEVAQANAAYIAKRLQKWDIVRKYLKMSAEQTLPIPGAQTQLLDSRNLGILSIPAEGHNLLQLRGDSIVRLGDLYWYGDGVAKSEEAALKYYSIAANSFLNPEAQFNLGLAHQFGRGLPQDFHLAKRYYDMSAQHSGKISGPSVARVLALIGLGAHFAAFWVMSSLAGSDWELFTIEVMATIILILTTVRFLHRR